MYLLAIYRFSLEKYLIGCLFVGFVCFAIALCKLLAYFGYQSLVRKMICLYFLPFIGYFFISLPELCDLEASPLGLGRGNLNSWGARCLNMHLPGKSWRLGLTVGESQEEKAREVPTRPFRF